MDAFSRGVTRLALGLAVLGGGLIGAPAREADAEAPGGMQILNTAICHVKAGGHGGHQLNWEFKWFYPDTGTLGSNVTIAGNMLIQYHNPHLDTYRTVAEAPYGLVMTYGHVEARPGERSSTRHWVYDHVRMETTWTIQETGQSGTQVDIIPCTVEPAPEGKEPIQVVGAAKKPEALDPEEFETFVTIADPSPHPLLEVNTWLYCEEEEDQKGANREVVWGVGLNNRGVGGGDGVLVSGSIRISVRGPGGAYTVASDQPFAVWLRPNEQSDFAPNLFSKGLAAAKMELFYRMSYGTELDPGQPERKVLRTTACDV